MTKCLTVYTALNCCTGWRYIQNRPISLRENSKWDTKTNILVLPFLCPGLKLVFRELYNRYQCSTSYILGVDSAYVTYTRIE